MHLVPVASRAEEKKFIEFPVFLYRNHRTWIRPLDSDIQAVFDPKANRAFDHGDCRRWLLEENGRTIGRIAAFIIRHSGDKEEGKQSAGIGFFECIDNQKAADLLFNAAKEWLSAQGATYMDGPINFGRRDKWWGLLTKGFDQEPNYQSNYNFPYYQKLFETYGFQTYYQQYTFLKPVYEPLSQRLEYKANLVSKDPAYTFEHLKIGELERFTRDIIEVYNKAWVKHEGVQSLSMEQGRAIIDRLKPILDEKIIWVAYYHKDPVAIFICIPEVNQILKHVNGHLDLWGKLKFFWHKKTGRNRKMLGMVFGVVPEHQGKGVDGAIIHKMARELNTTKRYETLEMNGIGDFNPKMIMVVRQVGGAVCKVHATYRYLFDRTQPFERMKSIR
ncbi:MAG: hypothetical protein P8Z38_07765 [Robiginitalea sp.]|jgi:GNAT superfamily N-acetyltransferase